MEVTALCIRLMVEVLVLLVDHSYFAQKADAALPRVLPDRLQFFEYETVSVDCEEFGGLTEWRVMRKLHKINPTTSYSWNSLAPSCSIHPTFKSHSGEYWCEDAGGNTSDAVNIIITAGSVILDVPARPVKEGDDVILHCKKKTQSKHIADFYKDGSHLGTLFETNLIIQNVSKSDEGLYRCSISGAGESPQSWLAVLKAAEEETRPPLVRSANPPSLLWVVLLVVLLLMVVGLLLCREDGGDVCVIKLSSKCVNLPEVVGMMRAQSSRSQHQSGRSTSRRPSSQRCPQQGPNHVYRRRSILQSTIDIGT